MYEAYKKKFKPIVENYFKKWGMRDAEILRDAIRKEIGPNIKRKAHEINLKIKGIKDDVDAALDVNEYITNQIFDYGESVSDDVDFIGNVVDFVSSKIKKRGKFEDYLKRPEISIVFDNDYLSGETSTYIKINTL
jgi:hypothetical protein